MLSREERERRKAEKKGISFEEQMALKGLPLPEKKEEPPSLSLVEINQMIDEMLDDATSLNEEIKEVEKRIEQKERTQTSLMDRLIAEGII